MEIEFFCNPSDAYQWFDFFLKKIEFFLTKVLNIDVSKIKTKEHSKEELSHYSEKTIDYLYLFPHGWSELWGIAYRTDYDLKTHEKYSKKDLSYFDSETNQKFIPHVIEPSVGVERLLYALCYSCYDQELLANQEIREILHFNFSVAPYKFAVLPLTNKLNTKANEIYELLLNYGIDCNYDASGSIGKRYRRQDAIGTPYCLTIDFDTLENNTISIRERDSMEQIIININDLNIYLNNENDDKIKSLFNKNKNE